MYIESSSDDDNKDDGDEEYDEEEEEEDEVIRREPLPRRDENGTLYFEDEPNFTPNMTPKEMLREGSFGGTMFWCVLLNDPIVYKNLTMSHIQSAQVFNHEAGPVRGRLHGVSRIVVCGPRHR